MIFMINFKQLDTKIMNNEKYSLCLNEVRKNLAANLDRSPLIGEPLNKSYGVSASPETCRCKAQREGNGLSPWRGLQRGICMLQGSPSGASSAIRTQCCNFLAGRSMPAKSRLDSELRWKPEIPIGLVQRFLSYCYASAGDRPTLFAKFSLSFVPFMQYAG
jgi:hypothetical protein